MKPVAYLTNRKTTLNIMELPAKLGRNENAVDVCFFHETVSREHCLFECINRRITIRDLNSTVGTYINGVRLEPNAPYNIEEGMKLTFGKVKFVFHADYDELARREHPEEPVYVPEPPREELSPQISSDANGKKIITISAKKLNEYEYDESEVVMIDCGISPEGKPLSYTSEIRKKEMEDRLREEAELKNTQAISMDEIEEAVGEDLVEDAAAAEEIEAEASVKDEIIENEPTVEGIKEKEPEKVLVLRWVDDETGDSRKLTIDFFPFRIGRKSDDNDFAIRKKGVSRTHLIFDRKDGGFFVRDDDSTNGVKVNGDRIEAGTDVRVGSGDSIRIAGITFSVREE